MKPKTKNAVDESERNDDLRSRRKCTESYGTNCKKVSCRQPTKYPPRTLITSLKKKGQGQKKGMRLSTQKVTSPLSWFENYDPRLISTCTLTVNINSRSHQFILPFPSFLSLYNLSSRLVVTSTHSCHLVY